MNPVALLSLFTLLLSSLSLVSSLFPPFFSRPFFRRFLCRGNTFPSNNLMRSSIGYYRTKLNDSAGLNGFAFR